jgi:hypothetical protein
VVLDVDQALVQLLRFVRHVDRPSKRDWAKWTG